ncbi:secretory carrier-associated membrane protein 1-like isoform X2 [Asterias amurensis]|uniref:secretory carrier-associated membrane protein 1-like isoform X2 n=1 Tax=Asterias amurensis TaxID=7602 RepID=UPI003AB722DE
MTDYDSNPFADPEAANPFQDPSVQQATSNSSRGLEEFNPFEERNSQTTTAKKTTPTVVPPTQPAVMEPSPPPYSPSAAQPAPTPGQEDLLRRQEELERKAAELQRREQQMRSAQYSTRVNNWPPLPSFCPMQPCFYQDFAVDIPLEFQRIVKIGYYIWIIYVVLLLLNVVISLIYLTLGISASAGLCFGFSLLFLAILTPCSFVCWYRSVYKSFRSDSSFSFFMFFFVFGVQFLCTVVQAIGIDQWGSCGWINGFTTIGGAEGAFPTAVGVMMLIMGLLFTLLAIGMAVYLTRVHGLYRSTGASFQKAQEEFARGVVTNPGVQSAAKDAGRAAATGAADAAVGGVSASLSPQSMNKM